jgi:hypothetical protein
MTFARLTYEFQFHPFQQFKPWGALDLDVASGHFSKELRRAQKNGQLPGLGGGQHYETPIDLTYRLEFRTSAFFIQRACNISFSPAARPILITRWCSVPR